MFSVTLQLVCFVRQIVRSSVNAYCRATWKQNMGSWGRNIYIWIRAGRNGSVINVEQGRPNQEIPRFKVKGLKAKGNPSPPRYRKILGQEVFGWVGRAREHAVLEFAPDLPLPRCWPAWGGGLPFTGLSVAGVEVEWRERRLVQSAPECVQWFIWSVKRTIKCCLYISISGGGSINCWGLFGKQFHGPRPNPKCADA